VHGVGIPNFGLQITQLTPDAAARVDSGDQDHASRAQAMAGDGAHAIEQADADGQIISKITKACLFRGSAGACISFALLAFRKNSFGSRKN
jgi:hypothetical protein